jgi:hypothetical protein
MMQPIQRIYIIAQPSDFWLAKICLGSIRYWYPEIDVTLLLDDTKGSFAERELEEMARSWRVEYVVAPAAWTGYWTKANAFWAHPGERFLLLEADTVLLGPVLETLQAWPEDFVVEWPRGELLKEEEIEPFVWKDFFPLKEVQRKFPQFVALNFFFNGGLMVGRGGVIRPGDLDPFVDHSVRPTAGRFPDLFRWFDQGVLNFVLAEKVREGAATVRPFSFMRWVHYSGLKEDFLKSIRRKKGDPSILHFAGPKLPFKSCLPHNDILNFYEAFYYRGVSGSAVRRWFDFWKRIRGFKPGHSHSLMNYVDEGAFLRTRLVTAELRPRPQSHFPGLAKLAGA